MRTSRSTQRSKSETLVKPAAEDGGASSSTRPRRETEGVGLVADGDLCFALELRSSSHRNVSTRLRRETEGVGLVAGGDLCFALELRSSSHRNVSARLRRETEGVGFEPTETCASSVFKTDAIDHSATPPGRPKLTVRLLAGKRAPPWSAQSWTKSPEASTSQRPSSRTSSTFTSIGKSSSSPISTTNARSPSVLELFTRKRSGDS